MIAVVPGRNGDPAHWRLICRGQTGADVLATAPIAPARPWQDAVERVRDGAGDVHILSMADGHFQWTLTDAQGATIAESPATYRDADSCRQDFALAQRVARTIMGAGYHHTPYHRR